MARWQPSRVPDLLPRCEWLVAVCMDDLRDVLRSLAVLTTLRRLRLMSSGDATSATCCSVSPRTRRAIELAPSTACRARTRHEYFHVGSACGSDRRTVRSGTSGRCALSAIMVETVPGKRLQSAGATRSCFRDGPVQHAVESGGRTHGQTLRRGSDAGVKADAAAQLAPSSGRRRGGDGLLGPSWASPFGPACGGLGNVPRFLVAAVLLARR
jgi:hypothetical protein